MKLITGFSLILFLLTGSFQIGYGNPPTRITHSLSESVLPNLTLTKSASELSPNAGTEITFFLTLTNNGDQTAVGIEVLDQLPSGFTFISDNGQGTYAAGTGVWNVGTLEPEESRTLEIVALVRGSGNFVNQATVTFDGSDEDPSDNEASVTITPVPQADLSVTKSASQTEVPMGSNVTFTINVTNEGPSPATGIEVQDLLPSGLAFVSANSSQGNYNENTGLWEVGNLASSLSASLTIVAQVLESDGSLDYENQTEIINSDQQDPNPSNNSDSFAINPLANPSWTLSKTALTPDYSNPGDILEFELVLTNTGNVSISNVQVVDILLSSGPDLISGDDGDGILEVGESWTYAGTYEVTQEDIDEGKVMNSATASGDPVAGNLNEVSATAEVTADQSPLWSISKISSVDNFSQVGEEITYEITLVNEGNVSIFNANVSDPMATTGPDLISGDDGDGILEVGETWIFEATYLVTQEDIDALSITNEVTANGDLRVGSLNSVSDTETDQAVLNPAWTFAKSASPTDYQSVGQVITYTFSLENTGNVSISKVTIDDAQLTQDAELISGDSNSDGKLNPGEIWLYEGSYTVTLQDLNNGSITNNATVSGDIPAGTLEDQEDEVTVNALQNPSWTLTKVSNPNPASYDQVGDEIQYTIRVENTGNVSISNVMVADPSATTGPTLQSGDSNSNGVLDPGEIWVYRATYQVTQEDIDNGSYTNTATATGDPAGGSLDDASDEFTVDAEQNPSWSISKTVQQGGFSTLGEVLTYEIIVSNTGNVSITDVVVSDPFATTGPTFVSGSINDDEVLEVGETWTFEATHVITQEDLDAGNFTNTVTASGTPAGGNLDEVTDSESLDGSQNPQLSLSKTVDQSGYSAAGDELDYTIVITNTGNQTISDIVLIDPKAGIVEEVGTLEPGESFVLEVKYTVTQADVDRGSLQNTATATGSSPSGGTVPSRDSETLNGAQTPAMVLTKTVDKSEFDTVGEELTYTVTVQNTGNITINNLEVTDPLLSGGLTYVSGDLDEDGVFDVGETWIFTGVYAVTQEDIDSGGVENTATASGNPAAGSLPDRSDSAGSLAIQNPAWEMTKTATNSPKEFTQAGEVITYEIEVTNTGNVSIENVDVFDPGATTPPVYASGDLDNDQVLDPGETWIFEASYTVKQSDIDAGSFRNTATANGDSRGGLLPEIESTETVPAMQNPAWEITKTANKDSYQQVGEIITYTFEVENTGNISITNPVISDPMTSTPQFQGGDSNGNNVLDPGETWTYIATHQVTQEDINNGVLSNSVTANGTVPEGLDLPEVGDTLEIDAIQITEISVDKSVDQETYDEDGIVLTFTIEVENIGNVDLENVSVSDELLNLNESNLTLAPGEKLTFTGSITVTQEDVDNGSISNTASASANGPDGTQTEDEDTVVSTAVQRPAISVEKSLEENGFAEPGDELNYSIVVTNTGNVTLTDVTITDPLTGLDQMIPSLAPGESVTIDVSYQVTQEDINNGTVTNDAQATALDPNGQEIEDGDSVSIDGAESDGLTILKTANVPGYAQAGDVITYTLVVTNSGNKTLVDVEVTDPLTGFTETIPVLEPGDSQSFTVTYTITQEDVDNGSLTNTANVSGTDPAGITVEDSDDEILNGAKDPSLRMDKSVSGGPIEEGQVLTYTIVITNDGNQTISDIVITDDLDPDSPVSIGDLAPGDSFTYTFDYVVTAADEENGAVSNTANVSGQSPDGNPIEDSDTANIGSGSNNRLELEKDVQQFGFFTEGDVLNYTIRVRNRGSSDLIGIEVIDSKVGLNETINLNSGESQTFNAAYTVTQQDLDVGFVENTATATVTAPDEEVLNVSDTEIVNGVQTPRLKIDKQAQINGYSRSGNVIPYTIIVANTGNVTQFDVVVVDPLTGLNQNIGDLAPGDIVTLNESYTVVQNDLNVGFVINTATATGNDFYDRQITASSSDRVGAALNPRLVFTKSVTPTSFSTPDTDLNYTITVSNTGNITYFNLVVSDPRIDLTSEPFDLNPGESRTFTGTYVTTQEDLDIGQVTNTASVSGEDFYQNPINRTDSKTVNANRNPQITVTKSADVSSFTQPGDRISYTLVMSNTGNITIDDPVLNDPKVNDLTYIDGDDGDGVLQVGESWNYTASYLVTQEDIDAGEFANTATATGNARGGGPVTGRGNESVDANQTPGWILTKRSTNLPKVYSQVGEVLTYELRIQNVGNVSIRNINLSDPKATQGPSFVSGDVDNDQELDVDEVWTYSASYTITQADLDRGSFSNTATVSGTPAGGNLPNQTATETVPAIQTPRWTLTKTSITNPNTYSRPDQKLNYNIVVTNTGNVSISEVVVTDPLLSKPPTYRTGDIDGDRILDVGEAWTYAAEYTVTQEDIDAERFVNTASAVGTPAGGILPQQSDDELVFATLNPRLRVTKTVNKSGFITVGESLVYTIVVANTGNMTLFNVEVLDPKTGLEESIPQLNPGESVSYTETYLVTQQDLDEGSIINTATATSTTESGTPVNGQDSASINGAQNPKIDIQKTVGQSGFLNVGDELVYTLTVTNSGNVTLFDVEVSDPKLSFSTTIDEMIPGQVEVYSGSYFVQQIDIDNGQIINIATARGNDFLGNDINDFAVQRVTGVQNPRVSSSKSSPQTSYSFLGEVINYEIRINNTGNVTLYDVQVDDPKAEITSVNPIPTIEPGTTAVVTARHIVTQADLDATTYSNQATALANLRVGDPLSTTTNRVTLNSVQNPSISIIKTSETADYDEVGDVLEYTLVVTNTGNVTLSNIQVTDPFAAIISGNPVGTLAPGQSATLTAEHVVTQADLDAGLYTNKSTVVGFSPLNVEVSAESETVSIPAIQTPAVEITKATSTSSYDEQGDVLSYTLIVTNTGNITLSEVTVSDPNAEIISGSPISTLAPGQSATVNARHNVELADLNAGFYTNQATVSAQDTNEDPVSNLSNEVTIPAVQVPAFELEKTALVNSYSFVGEEISYRLTVTNTGNVTLTNVLVSDPLTGTSNANLPDLDPGESASITVSYRAVTLEDLDRGFIENTANASADAPDSSSLEDSDTARVEAIQSPLIEIRKTANATTFDAVNDEIVYTIVVTNIGNVTLTNVVVTDPLTGLSETIPSLEPEQSETYTETILVTQLDLDNGAIDNTARTEAVAPDGTPITDVDNVLVLANQNGSIEIVKTPTPVSFNAPNTVISYTLEVTNNGNLTLLDVNVVDPLTGFTTTIDQLDPGQSETFTTTYTTTQADLDAGQVLNEATAQGLTTQNVEINDTDDARVVGSRSPGIEIRKTSSPKFFNVLGDEISFTFEIENIGNVTLTNVIVNDPRVEFTQVIPTLAPGEIVNLSANYTIAQQDVDNNQFENVASVTGTTPDENTVTDQDVAIVFVLGSPAIELEKTASPRTFDGPNQEITYTLTATNIGEQTLTQVVIVDDLTGDESAPVTLGPGESTTLIVTYETTQADLDAGRITNTALVTSLDPDDEEISAGANAVVLGQQAPSIGISKTAGQLIYRQVDEVITYEIVITNTGNVTLTDISFTDPLTGDQSVILTSSLAPGESLTITRTYSITQEDIDRGFLVNTASVSGTDPNGVDTEDEDDARVISFRQSGISVSKTPLTRFYSAPDISIGYEISVTNIGNTTLTEVEVTDPLTGFVTQLPELAPDQTEVFTTFYLTTQADVDRGFVENQATATGTTPAGLTVDDSDVALILAQRAGAIQLEKVADREVFTSDGELITYSLLVTNTGNVTLNTISVVDPLTRFDEVIPSLAPQESVALTTTYTARQEDLDAGEINNTATASGLTPASLRVTDSDSERVLGQQMPGISVVKTANPLTYAAADEVITYTLTVTNTGNVTLDPVAILDPLTDLDQTLGSLEVGETVTLTTKYTITQADVDAGEVTNIAAVSGLSPKGNLVEDQDDAQVTAIQNPGIAIEKSSDVNTYDAVGDLITYTLLVTNTGNVTLERVIVSDPLTELGVVIPSLAPQESVTLTEVYAITQVDLDAGLVVNTASTSGIPPSGVRISDQDAHTVRAIQQPAIDLVKTAAPTQYTSVGTVITYQLTVTNTGNVSLRDVRVQDPLTSFNRTVGTLEPNQSASLTATYTITQEDLDRGSVTNRALARGVAPDNRPVDDEDQVTVTAVQSPDIELTKTANVNSFDSEGDLITYTLEVINTGNVTLQNVTVEDPLTSTSEIVGTLAPGESASIEATYSVTQEDVDQGFVTNVATATGEAPDGSEPSDEDALTVEGVQNPEISLTKETGNLNYDTVGEEIAYVITVENTGNVTLSQVEVEDPLTGESILIPSLAPGEEIVLNTSYFVTQEDLDGGSVLNTATVEAVDPNGESVSDEDEVTSIANQTLGLEVTKSPTPLIYTTAGTVITYQILVKNIGNVTLSGVNTQDPQTGFEQIQAVLAPGETIQYTTTYTVTQEDLDFGSFTNTVTAEASGPNGEFVEDQDQARVFARQIGEIEITKTPNTRIFDEAGEEITYTIVVTNTGNVTLTEAVISDPQTGLNENLASLAPGESLTFTTTYTLTQTDVNNESFRNTATATGIDPNGETVRDEDDARVFVRGAAAIELTKTPSPRLFNSAGEVITYTFTVVNVGNQTLTDIVLSDPKIGLINQPLGTLEPRQSTRFTATYLATQEDMDAGFIFNQASVSSLDPDNRAIEDTDFALVGGIRSAAIELIKTPVQRVFDQAGDAVDYTLTVTNVGNVTLTDVVVNDPLTEFTSNPLTLAPGESEILSTSYTIIQDDLDAGFVRNTADAVGISPSGRPVESTDNALVLGRRSAAIQIDKAPLQRIYAAPDEEIFYELTITNTGNVTLTNVGVVDELTDTDQTIALLEPGETRVITVSYTTTQEDLDRGFVLNTASVSGTTPAGRTITDSDRAIILANRQAAIELIKENVTQDYDEIGDILTYSLTVTNTGNVTLTAIRIEDPLTQTDQVLPVDLSPGESETLTVTYEVTQDDLDRGDVENQATVSATTPANRQVQDQDNARIPAVQNPGIDLVKSVAETEFDEAGDILNYTLVVTNTGNVTLSEGSLIDPLTGLNENLGTLAPGESAIFSVSYTVTQQDVDAGFVTNLATATGTDPNGVDTEDEDEVTVTGIRNPEIQVTKTALTSSYNEAGDVLNYQITVTNTGNVTLTNVKVNDPLTGLAQNVGTLAPGQSVSISTSYPVNQADVDTGLVNNQVDASGQDPDLELVEDSDTAEVAGIKEPSISILKEADASSVDEAGSIITYTLTITNTGNVTLSDGQIEDPLTGFSGTFETLAPGESITRTTTYVVTLEDMDAGEIPNTATVEALDPDQGLIEDEDSELVEAIQLPLIEIVKKANVNSYDEAGQEIVYTLTVTNLGNVTLTNVTVSDPLTDFEEGGNTLEPGESLTLTTSYLVSQEDVDAGFVENTATATGLDPNGQEVEDEDSLTLEALQVGSVNLTKTASPRVYRAEGDIITYTLTVTNTGNLTLTSLELTDPLTDYSETFGPLAPGQSQTFTTTYSVTQEDVDGRFVINDAQVVAVTATDEVVSDQDQVTVVSNGTAAIEITKTAQPFIYIRAGQVITYTLEVTNIGTQTLSNVRVTDPLTGLDRNLGSLAPTSSRTLVTTYTVTQADVDNGSVSNTATVTALSPNQEEVTDTDAATVRALRLGRITIDKSPSPRLYRNEGDIILYTIVIENTGNVTLTDVQLSDPLTGALVNTQPLAPGQSRTFTERYAVTQEDVDRGFVLNRATVVALTPTERQLEESDLAIVFSVRSGDLQLTKEANVETYDEAGDEIIYTLTATNSGNVTLRDVVFSDPLTDFEAVVPVLSVGESESVSFSYLVTQEDLDQGFVPNTATVQAITPAERTLTDQDSELVFAIQNPEISIEKSTTTESFDEEGDVIEYSLTVTNTGNVTLTDVTITDPLTGLDQNIGTLAPGESETITTTYTVTQQDVDRGSVTNLAT
ncbi:DUF7507 domain-containing protein, partial [Algoriphagus confluentis]|uniref:DUF7507 domain-containing protein n=1 Tax=Algoriphagus confluentis TaxID=1697556 RepID=UPI0030C7228A